MMTKDDEINAELQNHKRISRSELECTGCGYKGRMGLLEAKKAKMLVLAEKIIYVSIALLFFLSYFAENETVAYTIRMVVPAVVFVIFIYIEQKLKTHIYSCPNCKALKTVRGSQ